MELMTNLPEHVLVKISQATEDTQRITFSYVNFTGFGNCRVMDSTTF